MNAKIEADTDAVWATIESAIDELLPGKSESDVRRAIAPLLTDVPEELREDFESAALDAYAERAAPAELRSDLGNARRLVRLYGEDMRYCTARGVWLIWDGSRWCEDELNRITGFAKLSADGLWDEAKGQGDAVMRFAIRSQDAGRIEATVKMARSESGVAVSVSALDSDPWLLNCKNGVLDLRTGLLSPPRRDLLQTKQTSASFDPEAKSELWDRFVSDITGGDQELAAYIQRALGYSLYGAWQEKAFWFAYGPPNGGKSTLFEIVGAVLGDYVKAAASSTWMRQTHNGGNRGDLVRLLGARLVYSSEIKKDARVDEETVKRVTGGDTIVAAAKYEGEIQFRPTFALWWFANDAPKISDDDEGMWSRARVVPLDKPVPSDKQDKRLAAKLTSVEHAPAVLNWLVQGCLAWQREGIGTCAAVDRASKAYRDSQNQAAGFVEDRLVITGDQDDVVSKHGMMSAYLQHCTDTGVRYPMQPKALAQRLRDLGAIDGGDRKISVGGGKRERIWRGVRLERHSNE